MKILHLNTDLTGGAARAAIRLHRGLQGCGADSTFVVRKLSWSDTSFLEIPLRYGRPHLWHELEIRCRTHWLQKTLCDEPGFDNCSASRSVYRSRHLERLPACDVYNLHWVSKLLDWPTMLPWLARQAPLVWTLHDMNPFQGIWHYRPQSHEQTPKLARWNEKTLKIKARALSAVPDDRLTIVAPSRWLADEARNSQLLGRFPTKVIPYGLDTEIFAPIDKAGARKALRLPVDAFLIGFVAHNVNEKRKGFPLLRDAVAQAALADLHLVALGTHFEDDAFPCQTTAFGRVESDRLLATVYAALDVFVCPSLQDNLPNTILESLACGRPVVAFDAGGIPDMVRPGQTGWLAPTGNVPALAEALVTASQNRAQLDGLGAQCREIALKEYPLQLQAQRYLGLYEELLRR